MSTLPVPSCVCCAMGNTQVSPRLALVFQGLTCEGENSQTGAPRQGRCCKQVKFSKRAERDVLPGGAEANILIDGKESKGKNTGDIGSDRETGLP